MAKVHGVKEIRAAIRRAPQILRDEAMEGVIDATKGMHQDAMKGFDTAGSIAPLYHGKPGMQNITGIARRNYRWSISKKMLRGRVGLLSSTAARRAFYLKFFLYGTSNQPARPVHDDAFEAAREPYIRRQQAAMQSVLTQIFL